jgi:hypothetical protein
MDKPTILLFIFVLAVFVGFEVISKVPSMLHTPLMSGTNAIHGIILFGGILVLADADSVLAQDARFCRGRFRFGQRLWRLHGHGPDAANVQEKEIMSSQINALHHHRRLGFIHPRHQVSEFAENRADGQPGRGGGHVHRAVRAAQNRWQFGLVARLDVLITRSSSSARSSA